MKTIIITIAITLCAFSIRAQNTLRPNIYFQNMNYYNPASGVRDTSFQQNLSLYLKDKYVNEDNDVIWNKPTNVYLNHIYNRNSKSTYNVSYIYDGYSFYSRNTIYAGYAHTFRLGNSQLFNIGGRIIFNFDKINWDDIPQASDKSTSEFYFTPDFDLGIQYQWSGLTLGVSTKNLFENSVKVDNEEIIKDWRELYINASYTFKLFQQNLNISPFVLYFKERDIELDAGLNFNIYKVIDVSYTLRTFELRSIYALKINLPRHIQIGMAIDHSSVFSDTNIDALIGYSF